MAVGFVAEDDDSIDGFIFFMLEFFDGTFKRKKIKRIMIMIMFGMRRMKTTSLRMTKRIVMPTFAYAFG
jgi:hypothetical protein